MYKKQSGSKMVVKEDSVQWECGNIHAIQTTLVKSCNGGVAGYSLTEAVQELMTYNGGAASFLHL